MGSGVSAAAAEAMRATGASAESLVIGPVAAPTEPMVVFYQLSRKFVDDERSVPKESSDILYYTLAVGHHTGVMDCFDEKISCTRACYERVCGLFEEGSEARYKMGRVLATGEMQVDQDSLGVLYEPVLEAAAEAGRIVDAGTTWVCNDGACGAVVSPEARPMAEARDWLFAFSDCLDAIRRNPAVYLMGRERRP